MAPRVKWGSLRRIADAQTRRQRLVEEPRLLARLERHGLADEARGALAVRRGLEPARDALAERRIEIARAVTGRARDLRERERVRLGTRPVRRDEALGPFRGDGAVDDAVDRTVERGARAEPGE